MPRYYYGTKTALDWILSHYFFQGNHYTWLANCFFPYKQANPKSSNPLLIYQDLYQPWKDDDKFDKYISQYRINLIKAIISKENEKVVSVEQGKALRELCNTISVHFFYPIVYRVDIDKIPHKRLISAGSAKIGSSEYLIQDLAENEFDILFLDYEQDTDFKKVVCDGILASGYLDSYEVLDILEKRKNV